jgi:hypothetical protein
MVPKALFTRSTGLKKLEANFEDVLFGPNLLINAGTLA